MHMGESYSEMQILWLDCVDGQADLNLTAIRNKLFFFVNGPYIVNPGKQVWYIFALFLTNVCMLMKSQHLIHICGCMG